MKSYIISVLAGTALLCHVGAMAEAQTSAAASAEQDATAAVEVTPADAAAADGADVAEEVDAGPVAAIDKYQSVMMSLRAQDWIRRAIKSYDTKIPVAVLMPDVFPTEIYDSADMKDIPPPGELIEPSLNIAPPVISRVIEENLPPPVVPELISFKSFVRLGNDRWVAWINDRKISEAKAAQSFSESNITIRRMRDERLFFVWEESQISRLRPDWDSDLAQIGDTDFYTNGRNIIVDSHTEKVGFFLSPGESFIGDQLVIYSGDSPPPTLSSVFDAMDEEREEAVLSAVQQLKQDAGVEDGILTSGGTFVFEKIASADSPDASPPVIKDEKSPDLPVYMNVKDRKHLLTLYAILVK